jgi:hypothetical protein
MRRTTLSTLSLVALALGACGPGTVDVGTEVELVNPETGVSAPQALTNLPIQLVPFDRDGFFDELAARVGTPEPQLPQSLRTVRDSIAQATEVWRQLEIEHAPLAAEVEALNREMAQYGTGEPMYQVIFRERNAAERVADEAQARRDSAFAVVDRLQQQSNAEMERFRADLTAWENEAFAGYEEALIARMDEAGNDIVTDTTDADGRASFIVPTGEWWVYARFPYTLQDEFYWNVPIEVSRDATTTVLLNAGNAEIRDLF